MITRLRHFGGWISKKGTKGQGLMEFAIVLPVFMLLVVGIIDLGRGVAANTVVSNAAHEGARAGIYPNTSNADIQAAINTQTALLGNVPVLGSDPGTGTYATVSPAEGSRLSGNITVTIYYRFHPITPILSNLVGSSINLSASSAMVIEGDW